MSDTREHFSSRLGFILAAAGSAVGIGNLVGFPVFSNKKWWWCFFARLRAVCCVYLFASNDGRDGNGTPSTKRSIRLLQVIIW